ncbi:hypothetical protein OYT13_15765 [Pandoraea sp. XJJ-1]|uniref:hypothetical protein n=1 Tax=Pandoraea sp. XJJ-1 TaxID=3002643 RepID=UPI00227FDF97|nr:hypothetical protein [Pandoraea sp. XJJ-1]WAL81308.1 hypothetical protein OYT13_15765 [Pandoraea sp. XJJ-1]
MPFNGSGLFNLLYNWQNDAAQNLNISSSRMQNQDADIASGLSDCITKDGQTTPTANLPMGGFRHLNVANAVGRGEYAAVGQVQDSAFTLLGSIAGTDTITGTLSPAITAYAAGQRFDFISAGTNTTTAVTLNINGLGAKSITKSITSALAIGDMPKAGARVSVFYDGTRFQLAQVDLGSVVTLPAGQTNALLFAVDSGAANAAVADYYPAISALVDGMVLWFKAKAANTGAATINVNSLGVQSIVGLNLSALQGGEIVAGGQCGIMWSAALGVFILFSSGGGNLQIPAATKSNHAINRSQALGVGQTWSDQTANRAIGTVYTNNGNAPIQVIVCAYSTQAVAANISIAINGSLTIGEIATNQNNGSSYQAFRNSFSFIVPPGATYVVSNASSVSIIASWLELS